MMVVVRCPVVVVVMMGHVVIPIGRRKILFVTLVMVVVAVDLSVSRPVKKAREDSLVDMSMVVMVVCVLVALVSSHPKWCCTSVIDFIIKDLLIFDSFRFSSIL
jgi:hypothetical protein